MGCWKCSKRTAKFSIFRREKQGNLEVGYGRWERRKCWADAGGEGGGGDGFTQMQKTGDQAERKMRIAGLAIMSLKSSEHPSGELSRPLRSAQRAGQGGEVNVGVENIWKRLVCMGTTTIRPPPLYPPHVQKQRRQSSQAPRRHHVERSCLLPCY